MWLVEYGMQQQLMIDPVLYCNIRCIIVTNPLIIEWLVQCCAIKQRCIVYTEIINSKVDNSYGNVCLVYLINLLVNIMSS